LYPDAKPISELLAQMQDHYLGGNDDTDDMLQSLEAIRSAEILNNKKISVTVSN